MNKNRALILGGGGSTGNAWLIGVVAGFLDAGIDVRKADLIVGTSAGATAAAQIAAASPIELYHAVLEANYPARPAASVTGLMDMTAQIIAASSDLADMRRRIGAAFLELDDPSDWWRRTVASRLPRQSWSSAVKITAVEATSGRPVVFDQDSGIDLIDAVAASCAGGFAYRIGDRRYIDGGYRVNAENADLATGYERVLVLTPFGGRSRTPREWGTDLATQVANLTVGGSRVETVAPVSQDIHGASAMDLTLRPAAARAGFDLGRSVDLETFWT